ncbi:MAG TPA: glycosyltransferase family 2 protein [Cyanobacteria bacterium UBA8530]|nr:glycosyltransferase family 2 protein [Cyanobacteria bacterium UBA8530]
MSEIFETPKTTDLSILIVCWNSAETIAACLGSLPQGSEVIVVDNASTDATVVLVRENFPWVRLIESKINLGFGSGCNLAASHASRRNILLLNPDTSLSEDCLKKMLAVFEKNPDCGAVGPRVMDFSGEIELSWGRFPSILAERQRRREQRGKNLNRDLFSVPTQVDWASGACLLLRFEAWEALGGFDENFFLYFEDLDLCARLKKLGWSVFYEPSAVLNHERGHSSRKNLDRVAVWYRESQIRYYSKHLPFYERLFLHLYLTAKFFFPALAKAGPARSIFKAALAPLGPGGSKS